MNLDELLAQMAAPIYAAMVAHYRPSDHLSPSFEQQRDALKQQAVAEAHAIWRLAVDVRGRHG